jgi:hypothetical protein
VLTALGWLAVAVLIAANALFVAAEFGLTSVDRAKLARLADEGDRRAKTVQRATRELSFQLSGAQLGITVCSLLLGFVAEPVIAAALEAAFRAMGLPDGAVDPVALVLALALATVAQMLFGELVPQNLALARPLPTTRAIVPFQLGFTRLCRPVSRLFNNTANAVVRMFGVEPQEELRSARTPAELAYLATSSAEQGALPTRTAQLLRRALAFGDKTAADVMTPRVQIEALRRTNSAADLLAAARASGRSRFPVFGDSRGRMARACDTNWTWPQTASEPPRELFRLAAGVWEASVIAFSRVRAGVWTIANVLEAGVGAPTRLDFLQTGVGTGKHGEWGTFDEYVDLVDFILPFSDKGADLIKKAQAYQSLIAESASWDPYDLTQEAGLAELALIERRGRAVEWAQFAFVAEHEATEMGFEGLAHGMALLFRLSSIAEAARFASNHASTDASNALRVAAMALDSATPLWLEDDDGMFICLRGIIEQTAQARTWRTKPAQATRLLAEQPSAARWVAKAGWGRLNPMLHAVGEFAHVSFEDRREAARDRLKGVLPQPAAYSRLRGDTLDAAALVLADEVAARLDDLDARLGAAFRREITLISRSDHEAQLESVLQRAMGVRTPPSPMIST